MPNGIWSTERERTRGGADARGFDLAKAKAGHWRNTEYSLPLTNGREYSEEEIWTTGRSGSARSRRWPRTRTS